MMKQTATRAKALSRLRSTRLRTFRRQVNAESLDVSMQLKDDAALVEMRPSTSSRRPRVLAPVAISKGPRIEHRATPSSAP